MPTLNDPFSRTLSEAIACGTFPLNSRYDDASYDLIVNKKNGLIFDPKNEWQFQKIIKMCINYANYNKKTFTINRFDTNNYSQAFVDAITSKS